MEITKCVFVALVAANFCLIGLQIGRKQAVDPVNWIVTAFIAIVLAMQFAPARGIVTEGGDANAAPVSEAN